MYQCSVICSNYPFQIFFDWFEVSGEDRIQFLHNQSTANFEALSEGRVSI